jgi:acyl-CoA thioesterase
MTKPQRIAELSARVMWDDDPASQALGMALVEVGPGVAVLAMTVRNDMVNGHGIGHGGFTFALADSAFAFACNTYNRRTVAQSCSITFLAPTKAGDVLLARAVERSRQGRNGIYDVTVSSGDSVVAEFRGQSRETGEPIFSADQP